MMDEEACYGRRKCTPAQFKRATHVKYPRRIINSLLDLVKSLLQFPMLQKLI